MLIIYFILKYHTNLLFSLNHKYRSFKEILQFIFGISAKIINGIELLAKKKNFA